MSHQKRTQNFCGPCRLLEWKIARAELRILSSAKFVIHFECKPPPFKMYCKIDTKKFIRTTPAFQTLNTQL